MKEPNFFVVGAPKCGTTALCEYMSSHPNIYISSLKEPHYFADDFTTSGIDTWEKYLNLFKDTSDEHFAIGEGSTHYLFSSSALKNIFRYNSNSKIVAMLRNPIDLVYSYHSQLLYNLGEDETDFEKAWELQTNRAASISIPKDHKNPLVLQYKKIGSLGSQVENLLSIFPSEQIKLVLFDDFKKATAETYNDVLAFLDVPSDNRTTFPKVNANKIHKNRMLEKITKTPPQVLVDMTELTKKMLGVKSLGIAQAARKLNAANVKRQPLSPSFRSKLFEEFETEIQKLSNLIERDLSHWRGSEL